MLHNTNQKTNNPIYGKELKTKQIFEIVEMSCKKEKKNISRAVHHECTYCFKLLHLNYVNTFTC